MYDGWPPAQNFGREDDGGFLVSFGAGAAARTPTHRSIVEGRFQFRTYCSTIG
jgi:hypothetical protein